MTALTRGRELKFVCIDHAQPTCVTALTRGRELKSEAKVVQ